MSSEAITRNDLEAILNEVLPPTPSEYKKLLWTNSSPTSAFAAQTISLDLSGYDEIEVEYSDLNDASHGDKMPQIKARVGERGLMGATFGSAGADYGSGSIYNATRRFAIGSSGITFDGGHGAVASGSYSARNDVCVPLRIYGIQYDYVAPPQMEIADFTDFFYPVGSYYETSDTSFDPNVSWGGTWQLETEGQVHISSGTNYAVSGALANTTDGGASTVTLTTSEIPSHTHGSKSLVGGFTSRRLYSDYQNIYVDGICSVSLKTQTASSVIQGASPNQNPDKITINATHEHDSVGGGGAHNNMPPYIIVNRWHRTA